MASGILDRLQENCRLAAETAHCVARFETVSGMDGPSRRRLCEGVEKRLWEVGNIMDQLALRERNEQTERMLRVARQTEKLWSDIGARVGANDDILAMDRRAA